MDCHSAVSTQSARWSFCVFSILPLLELLRISQTMHISHNKSGEFTGARICAIVSNECSMEESKSNVSSADHDVWQAQPRLGSSQSVGFPPFQSHRHALCFFLYQYLNIYLWCFGSCRILSCHKWYAWNTSRYGMSWHVRMKSSSYGAQNDVIVNSTLGFNERWRRDDDGGGGGHHHHHILLPSACHRLSTSAYLNRIHKRQIDSVLIGSDFLSQTSIFIFIHIPWLGNSKTKWLCERRKSNTCKGNAR